MLRIPAAAAAREIRVCVLETVFYISLYLISCSPWITRKSGRSSESMAFPMNP